MSCPNQEPIDPRVRRTKKLLQEALSELVHERPYATISVQDIAERATVNRATFYAHFPDKQALLSSILKTKFQESLGRKFSELPAFTPENLVRVTTAIFEFFESMMSGCPESASHLQSVVDSVIQEEIECLFRGWLHKDTPSSFIGHSVATVATILSWSIYGEAYRWSHGSRKRTAEAKARALVALLMPGVPVAA